jgi:hypothetical protein
MLWYIFLGHLHLPIKILLFTIQYYTNNKTNVLDSFFQILDMLVGVFQKSLQFQDMIN